MTPAISILCAVLLAVIAWLEWRSGKNLLRADESYRRAADKIESKRLRIDHDAALIAEAYALLHDTAARAKDGRWKPWAEARQKWAEKAGKA